MNRIQNHHSKLWFAGINRNWKLANFEVHEILETLDDIKKYQADRVESKSIVIIQPAIDSMILSIKNKNLHSFKKKYLHLTNACNRCHKATQFEFNIVKVPAKQVFDNQEFNIKK